MNYTTRNLSVPVSDTGSSSTSDDDNIHSNSNKNKANDDLVITILPCAPPPPNRGSPSSLRSAASPLSANERLSSYNGRSSNQDMDPQSDPATLIPLLANQVYHLPGNGWWQDWWQYMANNHPIFGICCRHTMHPLKTCTRVVALIGSLVFGLAITNVFYLLFLFNDNLDRPVATIMIPEGSDSTSSTADDSEPAVTSGYTLTTGMLLLWTVGGGIHTAYNLLVWHVAACACCRPGGCLANVACCPNLGKRILVRVLVLIAVVFAVFVIVMRIAISNQQEGQRNNYFNSTESAVPGMNGTAVTYPESIYDISGLNSLNTSETIQNVPDDVRELDFVWSYLIQMILSLFIYYPMGGMILFSGALGCGGRIPILGGRPREILLEEQTKEKQLAKQQRNGGKEQRNNRLCSAPPPQKQRSFRRGTSSGSNNKPASTYTGTSLRDLKRLEQGQTMDSSEKDQLHDDVEVTWNHKAK
jgi:hypothetical protein